ncbi:adenine phosphoribosyltransferase [bacterium]|nr:MAG: adenine phosphoribosyltransferase [bacterium]
MELKKTIRTIPDFPKKGIQFRDITTLIKNSTAFCEVIDIFHRRYRKSKVNLVAGIESRGFIFGSALAYALGVGFVPIRKQGKLPAETISQTYELEYGTDTLEIHSDAIQKGDSVLLVDDLIATGGSLAAAAKLIQRLGGEIVDIAVVIELVDLKGRERIKPHNLFSLVSFEGE